MALDRAQGVVAGRAAAALHGAKWIDATTPVELIADHTRRRKGVIVHEERIASDEITSLETFRSLPPAARRWISPAISNAMSRSHTSTPGRRNGRDRTRRDRPH